MTSEQRASVEARTRAELAMAGVAEGQIDIQCWPPLLVVQYSTVKGPARSNSRHLAGPPTAWIEQILSSVHTVLTSEAEPVPSATSETPAPPVPAAVVSGAGEPFIVPPVMAPKPSAARKDDGPTAATSPWEPEPRRTEPLVAQAGIGACAEVWGKPLAILPGACALVGLRSSFSRIAVAGGVQWSVPRVHDITIRHWQAGVEWSLGKHLWFAVAGYLSVFQLIPNTSLLPDSNTRYDPAVSVRGGISMPIAKQRLLVGAGVRLQPPHEVRIKGRTEFAVPRLALTTDVTYEFDWW